MFMDRCDGEVGTAALLESMADPLEKGAKLTLLNLVRTWVDKAESLYLLGTSYVEQGDSILAKVNIYITLY